MDKDIFFSATSPIQLTKTSNSNQKAIRERELAFCTPWQIIKQS